LNRLRFIGQIADRCVYRKPHPAMILTLVGKIPVLAPEFPVPPK
jgi:hypothetical protein